MSVDHGVIKAVYQTLCRNMADRLKIFHYVPQGVMPPYAVMELVSLSQGNGLPSPHFQARGEMTLRAWSSYEGTLELVPVLDNLAEVFNGKKIFLDPGQAWFEVKGVHLLGQQGTTKNPWREGRVNLEFVIQQ